MNYLQRLLENRLLTVLWENLPDRMRRSDVYRSVAEYLERYAGAMSVDPELAISTYIDFITTYNKHCKQFVRSGKYPMEIGSEAYEIPRRNYDIILLMSVLFTPHRFRIMEYLHQNTSGGIALFVGLGPGLEMHLTSGKHTEAHAYDLSVSDFLFSTFPNVSLNEELYMGQKCNYFDVVYLIELLEHISNPFELLKVCSDSLKKGGHIYLTTATNIPQFDHFYNFPLDHTAFDQRLAAMGLSILHKEAISHHYLTLPIKPYNHLYKLQKN